MHKLGRLLVAGLLTVLVALPTAALAEARDDAPLSKVPSAYVPALRAAAEGLGLSYDELAAASEDELRTLLCDTLDDTPTPEIVAQARAALDEAPDEELAALSDAERSTLIADLPAILGQIESRYCTGATGAENSGGDAAGGDDGASGDGATSADRESSADDVTSAGDIPVPTRVDTGGGGAGGGSAVPAAFGVLFAALFGLVGVGATARRSAG